MNRLLSGAALLGMMFAAAQALAAGSPSQSTLDSRQIKICMAKRMITDRTLAYNAAKRVCAEQLRARNDSSPPLSAASRSR